MLNYRNLLALLLAIAVLTVAGCAGAQKPVKVEGTVTLDGKPLAGATVAFVPAADKGRAAAGRSDADGSFRLTTYRTDDGALPGEYVVTVSVTPDDPSAQTGGDPYEMDPAKMRDYFAKASPAGKAREDAKQLKASLQVPAVYGDPMKSPLKETVPTDGPVKLNLRTSVR